MTRDLMREQAAFLRRFGDAVSGIAAAANDFAAALDKAADTDSSGDQQDLPVPPVRGPRQRQIVDVLRDCLDEDGLKTGEISDQVGMDQPNAYMALQALQKQGIVEMVPGAEPQRWRLTARYRLSRLIIEVGGLVQPGEWTSYGDISQVVYKHRGAGLAVARVASRSEDFPNPHRVLQHTGQIHEGWRDGDLGPEECARRLRAENVDVDEDFYAHMRHYIDDEELARRLASKRRVD